MKSSEDNTVILVLFFYFKQRLSPIFVGVLMADVQDFLKAIGVISLHVIS